MAILLIESEKHGDKKVFIDNESLKIISDIGWCISGDGKYVTSKTKDRKLVYMHRLISGAKKGDVVDHKNLNTFDNRKENLRLTDHHGNSTNKDKMPKKCSSIYKGVIYDKQQRIWIARVNRFFLKKCKTEVHAAYLYNKVASVVYGKMFRRNDIDETKIPTEEKRILNIVAYEKLLKHWSIK